MSSRLVRMEVRPRLVVEVLGTMPSLSLLSGLVQRFLVGGCGLAEDAPSTVQFRLAIQEAVTNVIRHSYAGREPGPIELELRREGDTLVARLRDEGRPFDLRRDAPATMPGPDALAEGGYGLPIIAQVMDEVRRDDRPGGGNDLVMRKRLW